MLLLVTIVACTLALGVSAIRIHYAAEMVEANGGNVWLGETLYTGSGFGVPKRTNAQVISDRARIMCNLLCGGKTELWVCYLPNERDEFCRSIELLDPSDITFEVLGETDRSWLLNRFPHLKPGAIHAPKQADRNHMHTQVISEPLENQAARKEDGRQEFIESMEAFDAFLAQNPKLSYRLQRYETLIGYPVQGEMGRMRDNDTGRIIYLPWPK